MIANIWSSHKLLTLEENLLKDIRPQHLSSQLIPICRLLELEQVLACADYQIWDVSGKSFGFLTIWHFLTSSWKSNSWKVNSWSFLVTPVDDRWTQHISTIKGAKTGQGHRVQGVSSVQGVEVDAIVVVDVVVDIVVVGVETERLDHHPTCKLPGTPRTPR